MTLWDTLAASMPDLLARVGRSVTVTPRGAETTFAASAAFGDLQPGTETVAIGETDGATVQVTVRRTTWRAGMQTVLGTARDAKRGDQLVVAGTDAEAGTWMVTDSAPDNADAILLTLRRESFNAIAGAGAREVR